jgi:hypothetical protein
MRFPFSINNQGSLESNKSQHIRQQIEQILFTNPQERWYRPDFGAGIKALVFEPNNSTLWELTKQQLLANLAESLKGDVLPESLTVEISGKNEKLEILITYQIPAIQHTEKLMFHLGGEQ